MSSFDCLREFMSERVSEAAEKIFQVFEKTIVEYEEEIDRQRRLYDVIWQPEIKLHRIKLPQQHGGEEVFTDQQLRNQERNSSLDQEDSEPPQIKKEQEELCVSVEGEQLVLKQETETFMLTPTCEESDNSIDQTLDLNPDEIESAAENEHVVSMSVNSSIVPEPNSDDQLLSHNSDVAESQDHEGGKQGNSGSTRNTELKPQKRHHKSKSQSNNEHKTTMSKFQGKTHKDQKDFKCDICGKAFKYMSLLKRHLKSHKFKEPYSCNICGRTFSQKSAVDVHMRIHTGEKPYSCDTCGKKFSERGKLKVHMRVHTGEKPYSCDTCGRRFSHLGSIRWHMRVHTGEKPYSCDTCGKRFSYLSSIKVHLRSHTREKPYPCSICGKRFTHQSTLRGHMRVHKQAV